MAPTNKDFKHETYLRSTALIKARLSKIKNAVDQFNSADKLTDIDVGTLKVYCVEVEKKKENFESILEKVLSISENETVTAEMLADDQDFISDTYLYIVSRINALLPSEKPDNESSLNSSQLSNTYNAQLRLPKLNLPTFDGNLEMWISFINLFDATIHENNDMSPVLKFQYLLSVIQGEPLNLIKSLNLTSENYSIAYKMLRERYHNDRRLQSLHLNNLLDLQPISASRPNAFRQFLNGFTENSQALDALNCSVGGNNPILSAVLLRKMDVELRKRFEGFRLKSEVKEHTFPAVKEIVTFLNKECTQLEDANLTAKNHAESVVPIHHVKGSISQNKVGFGKRNTTMLTTQSPSLPKNNNIVGSCFLCNVNTHSIYNCSNFKSKSPQDRFQIVKQHRHCVSCLGNHSLKQCKSTNTCLTCHKSHHTLLHFDSPTAHNRIAHNNSTKTASQPLNKPEVIPSMGTSVTLSTNEQITKYTVLLGTVLVRLSTTEGTSYVFRALLDSGSMCNLISERATNLLNVRRQKSTIQLSGIDHVIAPHKGLIVASLSTVSGQQISPHCEMLVLDKITVDMPRIQLIPEIVSKAQSYTLADPTFHQPGRIDMVIGNSLFPQLLTREQYSLGSNMPFVLGTRFGFVVMGNAPCLSTPETTDHKSLNTAISLHVSNDQELHLSLQKFWQQEEPPVASKKSQEEKSCDDHFANTHSRNADGRYILRLPLKESPSTLGESFNSAMTRLSAMERKFERNTRFSDLYHDFMDDYLSLEHMSPRPDLDFTQPHYFLPHHGILKENSSTTKLRTVFDASCSTTSGKSLNDILLTGKKLQTNICDILLQFRRHNVVFCCDIKQMYRQILIHPDDRDLQLILWRNQASLPVQIYQLNTVTYGVNSSPYLAIRTLHQLADDEGFRYPDAAYTLKNQTYVDDIITGADTETDALRLKTQLVSLLKCGGFELRKWISNSPQLLSDLPNNYLETPIFIGDSQTPQFSVLGLQWSSSSDDFSYNLQFPLISVPTKRKVLSIIAKLYDPCGFLSPFILLAKSFMQTMWASGCKWDEPLPPDLTEKWNFIASDTKHLKDIQISRSLKLQTDQNIQLHGFCDASESGFGAILYFRSQSPNNCTITTTLIIAKSKVSPLKRITLPRLELCAAHLLAKLVSYCRSIFPGIVSPDNIYLWSDSTIALTWLKTPSYKLKTFVANRVAETQELIPNDCWRHVPSEQNPADYASRGLLISQLTNNTLWWEGPKWLRLPSSDWPQSSFKPMTLDSSLELKPDPLPILLTNSINEEFPLLKRFSSWTTLLRVMAYVLRFIKNCKLKTRCNSFPTTEELHQSRLKIFWCVQQSSFSEYFVKLQHNECIKSFKRLDPFIDENGIIRVGGRLKHSTLPYEAKHPILLPKNHHVTHILIDYFHVVNLHAGPLLVQSLLSQQVWIIGARNVIRSRIHKCIVCFKHKPINHSPLMGDLPTARVSPSKPFLSTGVDYGGPFNIKIHGLRSARQVKVYICLFICMATKAVHIEVATDLTTDAFIECLTRFVSRRGACKDIYSDCGSNFIGTNAELQRIVKTVIQDPQAKSHIQHFTANQNITFHFNPPAAPHQGGLWERAIKSVKHHLLRMMGNTIMTLPAFITLTIKVEAMLNSRPLTPLSTDPSDVTALTPGHFLVGGPMVSLPELDFGTTPTNRLSHWQQLQQLFQQIWRKWSVEYLYTLQQRTKWNKHQNNLQVGDLVLMHEVTPPFQWPLARVTQIYPGTDGIVRVVQVKTSRGFFKRPVVKLYPLPILTD